MNPALRRIRWHLIWTSLMALVLSGGTFYLTQWVYGFSDDQCSWFVEVVGKQAPGAPARSRRVVIREILPEGVAEEAGLLEGDVLLEIHGRKVRAETLRDSQRYINEQPQDRILLYRVLRSVPAEDGDSPDRMVEKELLVPVRMVKPFNVALALVFGTGLVAWALGLLVVVSAPRRKVARHFYALGLLALLLVLPARGGMEGNLPSTIAGILQVTSLLVTCLLPPLWLHFCLRFPHPFRLRNRRRWIGAVYLLFAVMAGSGLLLLLAQALNPDPANPILARFFFQHAWARLAAPLLIIAATLGGVVAFGWGTFKVPEARRRALFPALLLTATILLDLGIYVNLGLWTPTQTIMFQRLRWIFFLPLPLLPLAFAYAILRHGILDVRTAILRWLSYFLAVGLTAGAYLAALAWVFDRTFHLLPPAWAGVLLGLTALPIGWLLRSMLNRLKRAFRRDQNVARELILGHLREGRRRLSEKALMAGLLDAVREAYRPQALFLLPVKDGVLQLPGTVEKDGDDLQKETALPPCTLCLPSSILRHARENRELVLGLDPDEAEWLREAGEAMRSHLDALEVQLLILIPVHEGIHSALLVGGKYAELAYSREDRELFREVAIAAGILLETAQLHRRTMDQERIQQEMLTARTIQESLITTQVPAMEGFQLALRLEPALETGGDLLWVKRRPSGRWIAAVGDVSGKGLAAALYMSQATALLKFATQSVELDFEAILPSLDCTLRNLMGHKDFLTLCLVEWDESGDFRLIRAGHPPPLRIRGGGPGDWEELVTPGLGLGLRPAHVGGWTTFSGTLNPGEWLVLFSDGLTEAMDQGGQTYGVERLQTRLRRLWGTGSVRAACESLFADVGAFDTQNRDDRTLLILGRNP